MEKPKSGIPLKYILAVIVGIVVLILLSQIEDPIFLFLLLMFFCFL